MKNFVTAFIGGAIALYLNAIAFAQSPKSVNDPDQFAQTIIRTLIEKGATDTAKTLVDTLGQPNLEPQLKQALEVFPGKSITYTDKVIDKQFGNSLRQIVYYAFVENAGFVYFRFNYKRSSLGWHLANFNFKSETNEIFPKDFVNQ